jgi:hypothetical protein
MRATGANMNIRSRMGIFPADTVSRLDEFPNDRRRREYH